MNHMPEKLSIEIEAITTLDLPQNWRVDEVPKLPEGYGYKGGVARAGLIYSSTGVHAPIRDLDIVSIDELNPDISLAEPLAKELMPRDFAYGDGVEHIDNIFEYFETRDFTINEVLLVNGTVYASEDALRAAQERVIKGSSYELELFDGRLGPKLAAKALLLQVVLEDCTGQEWLVEDVEDTYLTDFYLALALNKALMLGENITQKFIRKLQAHQHLEYDIKLEDLIDELSEIFDFDITLWPDYSYFDLDQTEYSTYEDWEDVRYTGSKLAHMW